MRRRRRTYLLAAAVGGVEGRVAGDLELLSSCWMRVRRRCGRGPWRNQRRGRATSSFLTGSAAAVGPSLR
jgi:hypothetical protein